MMTKVHGKRYAYKFDFVALYQAIQTQSSSESSTYKYPGELTFLSPQVTPLMSSPPALGPAQIGTPGYCTAQTPPSSNPLYTPLSPRPPYT